MAFPVGAVAGLVLALLVAWWLLLVGAACIVAPGSTPAAATPYGYRGLGEVSVFVFFGLVATVGTTYVQAEEITSSSVLAGVGCGALACAILVANNLRDIPTDRGRQAHPGGAARRPADPAALRRRWSSRRTPWSC